MIDLNAATFPAIPEPPPLPGTSDFISFEDFFKELLKFRVKRAHCTATDDDNSKTTVQKDYNLLRDAIKGKNKEKARQFLADFSRHFGFEPLSKRGGRA